MFDFGSMNFYARLGAPQHVPKSALRNICAKLQECLRPHMVLCVRELLELQGWGGGDSSERLPGVASQTSSVTLLLGI